MISGIVWYVGIVILSKSYQSKSIQDSLRIIERKKIKPLLETTKELLFTRFQQKINVLSLAKNYYDAFNEDFNGRPNDKEKCEFVTKYIRSGIDVANDYSNIEKDKDKDSYYNSAVWYKDKVTSIDCGGEDGKNANYDKNGISILYSFAKMIPILKALYLNHKEKPDHSFYFFYLFKPDTNLLISYPVLPDEREFYDSFIKLEGQRKICKDENGDIPDYFYVKCRDWYLQAVDYKKENPEGNKIFISHPYQFANSATKDIGNTICYIDDEFICLDVVFQRNFFKELDIFNKHLNGYFYILPTLSNTPLYYPNIIRETYFNDITRLEFPTTSIHSIEEVQTFEETIVPIQKKIYTDKDLVEISLPSAFTSVFSKNVAENNLKTQQYMKGGHIFTFDIFPVFFRVLKKDEEEHLLSMIYVNNLTSIENGEGEYAINVNILSIRGFIFYILMGGLLLTVFGQLIITFGKNITRPIRDIQARIKANSYNNKEEEQDNLEFEGWLKMIKNKSNSPSENTQREEIKEENVIVDEDDEELIPIKNEEITSRFDLILSLKKVFLFLENPQATFNTNVITTFLSSNEVFNEIQNSVGKGICLSNIGNLSALCHKYDKAITFLSDSIGKDDEEIDEKELANIKEYLDSYIKTKDQTILASRNMTVKGTSNVYQGKFSKKFNFLRYIKLFYAYTKFFSNLKKREHVLNMILGFTKKKSHFYNSVKEAFEYFNDYFVNLDQHTYRAFKTQILSCIIRLIKHPDISKKDEKIMYCLLEVLHLEINRLKIFQKRAVNETVRINSAQHFMEVDKNDQASRFGYSLYHRAKEEDVFGDAEKELKVIAFYYQKCSILKEKLKRNFKFNSKQCYKGFIYDIRHLQKKSSNVLLNNLLLEQYYNYLSAKFFKLCGDYSKSIDYYVKVIDDNMLISNALCYKKSNQKIIAILEYAQKNPEILSLRNPEKEEPYIDSLIKKCKENLSKLKADAKDVVIIADLGLSGQENKKKKNQQMKIINSIFEKYLSTEDRLSFYTFDESERINKIFPLIYKDCENYAFISSMMEEFSSSNDVISVNEDPNEKLKKEDDESEEERALDQEENVYEGMSMKYAIDAIHYAVQGLPEEKNPKRNQFIVIITSSFVPSNNENVNEYTIAELFKDWNRKAEKPNLVIIGDIIEEPEKLNLALNIFSRYFQTVNYFEFENYLEIKKLFIVTGYVPREYEFQNENYSK